MKANKIAQQLAIILSLGACASAHAQLLGGGGGLGGSVGGMVGGGIGRMGGIDASGMVRGTGRLDADIARPVSGMAGRAAERVREIRPETGASGTGRAQADGSATLGLTASGAVNAAGDAASSLRGAATSAGEKAEQLRTAGQDAAGRAGGALRDGVQAGAERVQEGASGSGSSLGSVSASAPAQGSASASLSLGGNVSSRPRSGNAN